MRHLLDVNVWVALLNEEHQHHGRVREFMADTKRQLAVCPLVENGVLRLMNLPAVLGTSPTDFRATTDSMRKVYGSRDVRRLADDLSLVTSDAIRLDRVFGAQQVTDTYLLALAVSHGVQFTTLDQRVTTQAVVGANHESLLVL